MKTILILLLLASAAFSQTPELSTVRIYNHRDADNDYDGWGSGFVVSDNQVITAYHVVHRHREGDKQVQIRFSDNSRSWATVEAVSLQHDLALLWINKHETIASLPLGEIPEEGTTITVQGFGRDYEFKSKSGTMVNRMVSIASREFEDYDSLVGVVDAAPEDGPRQAVFAKARPGDSGGPVTHEGKVIGVVLSVAENVTIFTRIDTVLADFKGKIRHSVLRIK